VDKINLIAGRVAMILRNISLEDEDTDFSPRVIAHRGLSGLCPENTLPAFGAAVALGVHEIEFDIWGSKDRELVICHDPNVNRTSNGEGSIKDLNWEDIKKLDAGSWFDARWANITFCRMEDICEQYAGKVTMNIHIKDPGEEGWVVEKSRDLIKKYNIEKRTYFAGEKDVLEHSLKPLRSKDVA
jgi:glycerophosphoryl diester phosphodiesterase